MRGGPRKLGTGGALRGLVGLSLSLSLRLLCVTSGLQPAVLRGWGSVCGGPAGSPSPPRPRALLLCLIVFPFPASRLGGKDLGKGSGAPQRRVGHLLGRREGVPPRLRGSPLKPCALGAPGFWRGRGGTRRWARLLGCFFGVGGPWLSRRGWGSSFGSHRFGGLCCLTLL